MTDGPRIRMKIGSGEWEIVLTGSSPETAEKIVEALPIENDASTWGEEIYFSIPVDMTPEDEKPVVSLGDVAYWPEGQCFCVFFGKTPMTTDLEEIRPASAVNVFGKIEGDLEALKKVSAGEKVRLEAMDR